MLSFLMEIENLTYPEAIRLLADKMGMEVPEEDAADRDWRRRRDRILELNKLAAHFYYEQLSTQQGTSPCVTKCTRANTEPLTVN